MSGRAGHSGDPVVIVGAGLAGLTCARRLQADGAECIVLEAEDAVGGRVRTDVVDGFHLDRGFQVLLTAYPAAQRWLNYETLSLRRFSTGALVWCEGQLHLVGDPWRDLSVALPTLRAPVGSVFDKLRVATLRSAACKGSLDDLFARPETTALDALRTHGFSDRMIERFLQPWLGGIFLEGELATSSRMLDFVLRMFAQGHAAVPAGGMQAIPEQLAAGLTPGTVRLSTPVAGIEDDAVRLSNGERIAARRVVVATDGSAAADLLPSVTPPAWRRVTCVYFAAPASPIGEPTLALNGSGAGHVNNVAVMSDVASAYAPPGQSLVSVSVLGAPTFDDDELARTVKAELAAWFGTGVRDWRWLRTYRVTQALPVRMPLERAAPEPVRPGAWVAGDFTATASIQGAMDSGERVAEALLHLDEPSTRL